MAQGSWNPVVNHKMIQLDEIKKKYDDSNKENKAQLKIEWDLKVDEIAATIRQHCGKNK
jgi:hypothetical protein